MRAGNAEPTVGAVGGGRAGGERVDFRLVNTSHPQQDVHRAREPRPAMSRYRFAASLLPTAGRGLRVLEIGGGMAEFAQRLARRGYDVTVADLSPSNVANARRLGFGAIQADLNLGLPGVLDAAFDIASMLDVVEHVVTSEQLLAEARRVLKPGGVLVLSTPNFAWWQNRLAILRGNLSHDEGYHYRFFTRRSLERQLREAGFVPEAWRSSSPAYGINKLRRIVLHKPRTALPVPDFAAPLLAQTLFVRARAE